MSSATRIYITMVAAFAAGLWAIISLGSIFLHAPLDLSGEWELLPSTPAEQESPAHTLSMQQSGRYSVALVDGARSYELKRTAETRAEQAQVTLTGAELEMMFSHPARKDVFSLAIHGGGLDGTYRAVRTAGARPKSMTAPKPTAARYPTTANAH